MKTLTLNQRAVYTYMLAYFCENHGMPTMQEMADHFKWRSAHASNEYLKALAKKGYLEKRGNKYKFTKFYVTLTPRENDDVL